MASPPPPLPNRLSVDNISNPKQNAHYKYNAPSIASANSCQSNPTFYAAYLAIYSLFSD